MKNWVNTSKLMFEEYIGSFSDLPEEFIKNFSIKRDHSIRVASISNEIAQNQKFSQDECKLAYFIGIFHDIGRFKQLLEFNTFNDSKSVNHAEYSIDVLKEHKFLQKLHCENEEIVFAAILNHNKLNIENGLSSNQLKFAKLIRDADKLDILDVLSDYYSRIKGEPNHTLTWELPQSSKISEKVFQQIRRGELVSKNNVENQADVKLMQLSWVYDFNFRISYELLLKNRYLEKIYNSLPKNDRVIEVYRNIKIFVENKIYQ